MASEVDRLGKFVKELEIVVRWLEAQDDPELSGTIRKAESQLEQVKSDYIEALEDLIGIHRDG